MTDTERAEQKHNQFFEEATAKHAALQAAGGFANNKTLRDEFAGLSIKAITSRETYAASTLAQLAEWSYQVADAMLEARKTTGEGE